MDRILVLLLGKEKKWSYVLWISIVAFGAYIVIAQYLNDLRSLVDLATTISFVIAPFAAILNYKVILSNEVAEKFHPPPWLKALAIAGICFLSAFTLVYFYFIFS
jgi:Mn2+/Fe2+ NRAMP family transporter